MVETQSLQNETFNCNENPEQPSTDETIKLQLSPAVVTPTSQQSVYDYLQGCVFPVPPSYIASKLGLNPSSVRTICRRLLSSGLIRLAYRGYYCSLGCNFATHGPGALRRGVYTEGVVSGPLLQNLVCVVGLDCVSPRDDYVFNVVDAEIRLVFGCKRNQVSLHISCSNGLSVHAFSLVVTRCEDYLISLGYPSPFDWRVVNYELLVDGSRVRLEGCEAFTLQVFEGELLKQYNKSYGVRSEFRSSAPVDLRSFMSIVSGAGSDLRAAARLGAVEDELRRQSDSLRYVNGMVSEILQAVKPSRGGLAG